MPLLPLEPPVPPSAEARSLPVEVRLSTERAAIDNGQHMGMTGLHWLRPGRARALGGAGEATRGAGLAWQPYGGVAVYGATAGNRGGFFGWGVEGGARLLAGPWSAEGGMFVGGGGGSPGWVGGGLMLRPHLGLGWQRGGLSLGAGVARLSFPSGLVRSTQPYVQLGWTADSWFGPETGGVADARWAERSQPLAAEVAGLVGRYSFRQSVRRDGTGSPVPLTYGGFVFRRGLGPAAAGAEGLAAVQPYAVVSAAGSLTAEYAGYAELLAGLGLHWQPAVALPVSLRAEALAGSGGAGALADTGGGRLTKLQAGLSWTPLPGVALSAMAGRVRSPGPFQGKDLRLELAWRGLDLLPLPATGAAGAAAGGATTALSGLSWAPWSISAGWSQFAHVQRDDGSRSPLALTTLVLARERADGWRLMGEAGIATTGHAGGYATGRLGLGWLGAPVPALAGARLGGELSLGAAGGGDVAVGGGLIGQAQAQARWALAPSWAVQADAGWLRGRHAQLSTPFAGISLVHSFTRLQADAP